MLLKRIFAVVATMFVMTAGVATAAEDVVVSGDFLEKGVVVVDQVSNVKVMVVDGDIGQNHCAGGATIYLSLRHGNSDERSARFQEFVASVNEAHKRFKLANARIYTNCLEEVFGDLLHLADGTVISVGSNTGQEKLVGYTHRHLNGSVVEDHEGILVFLRPDGRRNAFSSLMRSMQSMPKTPDMIMMPNKR